MVVGRMRKGLSQVIWFRHLRGYICHASPHPRTRPASSELQVIALTLDAGERKAYPWKEV